MSKLSGHPSHLGLQSGCLLQNSRLSPLLSPCAEGPKRLGQGPVTVAPGVGGGRHFDWLSLSAPALVHWLQTSRPARALVRLDKPGPGARNARARTAPAPYTRFGGRARRPPPPCLAPPPAPAPDQDSPTRPPPTPPSGHWAPTRGAGTDASTSSCCAGRAVCRCRATRGAAARPRPPPEVRDSPRTPRTSRRPTPDASRGAGPPCPPRGRSHPLFRFPRRPEPGASNS